MPEGENAAALANHSQTFSANGAADPFLDARVKDREPTGAELERGEWQRDVGDFTDADADAWSTVRGV
jgi:hypothetical protein